MNGRRTLVATALAICAVLVAGVPGSLRGAGIGALLALALVDVALVQATGGLAFARPGTLDERQAAVRDLAYRRAFRLLAPGLLLVVVLVIVSGGLWAAYDLATRQTMNQLDPGIGTRVLLAVLELLAMTPTFVVAWTAPDPAGDAAGTASWPRRVGVHALVATAVVGGWLATVAWAPAQAAGPSRSFTISSSWPGSTCRHFVAGRVVGAELGATVGMRVQVCWNGSRAFVTGDPSVPPPDAASIDPLGDPELTSCGADDVQDFAVVTGTRCVASTDRDGTLTYTVTSRVLPLPFGIGARDVSMRLVVTRSGTVLEQP